MRKFILFFLLVAGYCQFTACTLSSPEDTFNTAVLSCNNMYDFATEGFLRQLESPSIHMINGDINNSAPMKRKEVIEDKIELIIYDHDKLKQLKETSDTKEVIRASKALYDYVLPVYKKEYKELARLYDESATKEAKALYAQSIQDKYYSGFADLYDKLIAAGKLYAKKHNINVQWDIQTSPRL